MRKQTQVHLRSSQPTSLGQPVSPKSGRSSVSKFKVIYACRMTQEVDFWTSYTGTHMSTCSPCTYKHAHSVTQYSFLQTLARQHRSTGDQLARLWRTLGSRHCRKWSNEKRWPWQAEYLSYSEIVIVSQHHGTWERNHVTVTIFLKNITRHIRQLQGTLGSLLGSK